MSGSVSKYFICLILILCFIGCKRTPKGVLSESDMQRVMTDMLIAESLIGTKYQDFREDSAKMALYESVFRKHRTTRAQYDSSIIWYGKNLEDYMRLHDRVILDLNKQMAVLGDIQASAAPTSSSDSVNIWPRRSSFVLEPAAVFNGVVFDILPDVNYSSGSSFVLGARFWGLKDDLKYMPEIAISAVHRDTIITTTATISEDGYYETVLRTMPTRQIRRVYGYIRMDNNDKDYIKVYVDSLSLIRYNYGTEIPGYSQ